MLTAKPINRSWALRDRTLPIGQRTLVMGIVNVTPDSFSDGGTYLEPEAAVDHALRLVEDGADLLDIGGESTRPGSDPVPVAEELRRILPVLQGLAGRTQVPVSVDTWKAAAAEQALRAGAHAINDVTALGDPAMARTVARSGAGLVLMHMQGNPKTMQAQPAYHDVVSEVREFLQRRARTAEDAGVPPGRIVVDPGLGFGKRTGQGVEDNLTLLRHLSRIADLGYPVLVGPSRKSFIGNILRLPVDQRLEGSLAAAALAAWNGASIVRVHDVAPTRRALDVIDALRAEPGAGSAGPNP